MKLARLLFIGLFLFISLIGKTQIDTLQFENPIKLDEKLNSEAEESLPLLSSDGNTLYFARTFHTGNKGGKNSGQDIWFSEKSGQEFTRAQNMEVFNNQKNNVLVGVAKNRGRVYLLNQFSGKKNKTIPGLSISNYNDSLGNWDKPTDLEVPGLDIKGSYYSAYVNQDEDLILWSLPDEVDSLGNDIFISTSEDKGETWSIPLPVGVKINTDLDEISPFYDKENELLYFSRNKADDEFDYDIYYAKKMGKGWTNWSDPIAAKDLNSLKFDAYFMLSDSGEVYFSSNRNDSLSNIYMSKEKLVLPIDTVEEKEEIVQEEDEEPVLIIETDSGTTTDKQLKELTREELLSENTRIRFVYFDFDKYSISRKYLEVLDDAANILDEYPDIYLQIEGHTDAVGTEEYNQVLSEKRALSAKEYLLIHGVEPAKIKTAGYGKREPYASNFTEEGRAMNRRVELVFRKTEN